MENPIIKALLDTNLLYYEKYQPILRLQKKIHLIFVREWVKTKKTQNGKNPIKSHSNEHPSTTSPTQGKRPNTYQGLRERSLCDLENPKPFHSPIQLSRGIFEPIFHLFLPLKQQLHIPIEAFPTLLRQDQI